VWDGIFEFAGFLGVVFFFIMQSAPEGCKTIRTQLYFHDFCAAPPDGFCFF